MLRKLFIALIVGLASPGVLMAQQDASGTTTASSNCTESLAQEKADLAILVNVFIATIPKNSISKPRHAA